MMIEGDEWKHAPEPKPVCELGRRTRAQQQEWLDDQFARGKITRQMWRVQTDYLSTLDSEGNPIR